MSTDTSFSILHCHTQRKPFFPPKKKKTNSFKKYEKHSHILLKEKKSKEKKKKKDHLSCFCCNFVGFYTHFQRGRKGRKKLIAERWKLSN